MHDRTDVSPFASSVNPQGSLAKSQRYGLTNDDILDQVLGYECAIWPRKSCGLSGDTTPENMKMKGAITQLRAQWLNETLKPGSDQTNIDVQQKTTDSCEHVQAMSKRDLHELHKKDHQDGSAASKTQQCRQGRGRPNHWQRRKGKSPGENRSCLKTLMHRWSCPLS